MYQQYISKYIQAVHFIQTVVLETLCAPDTEQRCTNEDQLCTVPQQCALTLTRNCHKWVWNKFLCSSSITVFEATPVRAGRQCGLFTSLVCIVEVRKHCVIWSREI